MRHTALGNQSQGSTKACYVRMNSFSIASAIGGEISVDETSSVFKKSSTMARSVPDVGHRWHTGCGDGAKVVFIAHKLPTVSKKSLNA